MIWYNVLLCSKYIHVHVHMCNGYAHWRAIRICMMAVRYVNFLHWNLTSEIMVELSKSQENRSYVYRQAYNNMLPLFSFSSSWPQWRRRQARKVRECSTFGQRSKSSKAQHMIVMVFPVSGPLVNAIYACALR